MTDAFNVSVVLADVGQNDPSGKLHLLGVGWIQTMVGPSGLTPDFTVAVILTAPWDKCNRSLKVELGLVNEDDEPVTLPDGVNSRAVMVAQDVIVVPPPGAPNGSPGQVAFMLGLRGGLPLQSGKWYRWRVAIDGETQPGWVARFFVSRQPTMPTFGARSVSGPSDLPF